MKNKNKKIFVLIVLVVVIGLILSFVFMQDKSNTSNKTSGIKKQLIGSWSSVDGEECDNNMSEIITFRKDNTIEGIDGFNEYRTEASDHKEYDYIILSGQYEDFTRYRINFNEDTLQIVYEEDDIYDFNSAISCQMNKK